jgi:hypothetical protein
MIGGASLHIWLWAQIEQRYTLNRDARPHVEGNVSSCAKHPTFPTNPILRVLDRSKGHHLRPIQQRLLVLSLSSAATILKGGRTY